MIEQEELQGNYNPPQKNPQVQRKPPEGQDKLFRALKDYVTPTLAGYKSPIEIRFDATTLN